MQILMIKEDVSKKGEVMKTSESIFCEDFLFIGNPKEDKHYQEFCLFLKKQEVNGRIVGLR